MLTGSSVILRCWNRHDLAVIQELKNDISLQAQLLALPRPSSCHKIQLWLQDRDKDESMVFFIIAEKTNNQAIGYIQLSNLDRFNLIAYLGICITQAYQGTGCAKDALTLLSQYAVDMLNLRKIVLLVKQDHLRAIRFYQNNGFEQIGVLKKHYLVNGVWSDVLMMEKFIGQ
jgi:diamine N-acetyltransferase